MNKELYNEIPVELLTNVGFPTNACYLTLDQRRFIDWFSTELRELREENKYLEENLDHYDDDLAEMEMKIEKLEKALAKTRGNLL